MEAEAKEKKRENSQCEGAGWAEGNQVFHTYIWAEHVAGNFWRTLPAHGDSDTDPLSPLVPISWNRLL